jgi:DNA-directed RNA polymerase subunit M/transcription elongation factor TFIIS
MISEIQRKEEFKNRCLQRALVIKYDKDSLEKEYINRYNFYTKGSSDISFDLIREAEKTIDRKEGVFQINKYVKEDFTSHEIEKGLFEYSLLHVMGKKLDNVFVNYIYSIKLHNICCNLDENNKNIENKTLLKAIFKGELKPHMVACLSPQQMHPERWESIDQKRKKEDDAKYNPETTDEYECSKCKERKCTVEYVQLRSADEPANMFIVCVVCGTTIIL